MKQQNIHYDCRPNNHQPFLTFRSKARLIQSPTCFCIIVIFTATERAFAEPVPWCACFIGTDAKITIQMVQPFQLLFIGMYIPDQDFSLTLQNVKTKLSLRWQEPVPFRRRVQENIELTCLDVNCSMRLCSCFSKTFSLCAEHLPDGTTKIAR